MQHRAQRELVGRLPGRLLRRLQRLVPVAAAEEVVCLVHQERPLPVAIADPAGQLQPALIVAALQAIRPLRQVRQVEVRAQRRRMVIRLLSDRNIDEVIRSADPSIEIDVAGHKGPVKKRQTYRWSDVSKLKEH